jgi:hypothetical protein
MGQNNMEFGIFDEAAGPQEKMELPDSDLPAAGDQLNTSSCDGRASALGLRFWL